MANANFNMQKELDRQDVKVLTNRLNEVIGVTNINYKDYNKKLSVGFNGTQTDFFKVKRKIENCGHEIKSATFDSSYK